MKILRKDAAGTSTEVEVSDTYVLQAGETAVVAEEPAATDDIGRLETLAKGLQNFQAATVAGNGGQVVAKQPGEGAAGLEIEEKELHIGSLRNNFLRLSKAVPEFRHLEGNKAMDDPQTFLRETFVDIRGKRQFRVSNEQLEQMVQVLLLEGSYETHSKSNLHGVEFGNWSPTQTNAIQQGFSKGVKDGAFGKPGDAAVISKALDSGSGSGGPLIRQDIEPILREAYLRKFPLGDMIKKIPANGLVHSYDQRTDPGEAFFIDELGDLSETDSSSTYVRSASSHIGVIGARRQISLKLQYAIQQSGMKFDLSGAGNLEVTAALTAIARLVQSTISQGNYSTPGKTKDDEDGATNTKGFDGFRTILKGADTSITRATDESYLRVINRAVAQVVNAGGDADELAILMSLGARLDLDEELINFYRIMNSTPGGGIATNLGANGIMTVADTLSKIVPVPASRQTDGQGYYTIASDTLEDIDVIDTKGCALAYLGSPTPSILELPVGFNNALSNTYIPFIMVGLVVFIVNFHRKIRIARVII